MKKFLLFFTVFVFASHSIYSQNQDSIKYKILLDDPSKTPNLHLFLVPAFAEYFKANGLTVGWGLGANAIFNPIYLDFSLYNSLFLGDTPERLWNIGGGYVLGDNTYTSQTQVKVGESRHKTNFWTGNERWTEWYINPVLTHRDIYMVRGGMFIYNFHDNNVYNYSTHTYTTDRTVYPSIYGGVSMEMIDNSMVQPENGRIIKMKDVLDLYADILFAPMKKDITDNNGHVTGENNLLGFRVGAEYKKIKKVNALCAKLELGVRPCIKKEGFFVALNIYLPIVNIFTHGGSVNTNNNVKNSNF